MRKLVIQEQKMVSKEAKKDILDLIPWSNGYKRDACRVKAMVI